VGSLTVPLTFCGNGARISRRALVWNDAVLETTGVIFFRKALCVGFDTTAASLDCDVNWMCGTMRRVTGALRVCLSIPGRASSAMLRGEWNQAA
jgi:hypothetical protein